MLISVPPTTLSRETTLPGFVGTMSEAWVVFAAHVRNPPTVTYWGQVMNRLEYVEAAVYLGIPEINVEVIPPDADRIPDDRLVDYLGFNRTSKG